jgi:ABC-type branched-subunit amino acid transport system ATPase component
MGEPILVVADLRKRFGELRAIDGCAFSVAEGSVTGLIGPNGAGKTTVIDVISGFLPADGGTVSFLGRPIHGTPAHVIASHGLVRTFQQSRGWANLTVMENLLVAAPPRGRESIWRALLTAGRLAKSEAADRNQAREVLGTLGLLPLKNAKANTLSGGQRRLLEVARIMMASPRMVVLDEPVASVNPVMAMEIAARLKLLPGLGTTVLVVEHNLRFVMDACSDVIVMAVGRTIAHTPTNELYANQAVVDAYLGDVGG